MVPAKYSLLHAISIPSKGGNTQFADMRAAYDALDEETKAEVEDMVCEHSQMFSRQLIGFTDFTDEERERFRPVRQCMVRTHPVTGRKSLYLSSHAGGIVGWPMPEARGYLRDLIEHATQREFVYTHKWRVDDLVMWDNRQTMHRARPFPANEPRDMRRTTLAGDGPTVTPTRPCLPAGTERWFPCITVRRAYSPAARVSAAPPDRGPAARASSTLAAAAVIAGVTPSGIGPPLAGRVSPPSAAPP